MCIKVLSDPQQTLCTLSQFYHGYHQTKLKKTLLDQNREQWKEHSLYKEHTKQELSMCKKLKIPIKSNHSKHTLVKLISESQNESAPPSPVLYDGKLALIPSSLTGIGRLPVSKLRAILWHHAFPVTGTKDELALHVFLLRQSRTSHIFRNERNQLKDLIKIVDQLVLEERRLHINNTVCRKRQYASEYSTKQVPLPSHITKHEDLPNLFNPLLDYIDIVHQTRSENDDRSTVHLIHRKEQSLPNKTSTFRQQLCQPGAQISVKWSSEELGDSGWKPGWYKAVVQAYDTEEDTITVVYPSEPGCVYTMGLSSMITSKKIKGIHTVI